MAQATYLRHGGQPYSLRLVLLRMGLAYALPVTSQAVVSYTAFSPLPHSGGSFLLRFPEGYPCRTLSGILPCEARTFLTWHVPAAIVCPAEIQNIVSDSLPKFKCWWTENQNQYFKCGRSAYEKICRTITCCLKCLMRSHCFCIVFHLAQIAEGRKNEVPLEKTNGTLLRCINVHDIARFVFVCGRSCGFNNWWCFNKKIYSNLL